MRTYPPYAQGAFYLLSAALTATVVEVADVLLNAFNGSTAHVPTNEVKEQTRERIVTF